MQPAAEDTSDPTSVTFELRDVRGHLRGVRLEQEVGVAEPLDFIRTGATWRLRIDRPDIDRMEYLFEIRDRRGRHSTITDPANPRRAGGAFGDKSVLEFPEYQSPAWLDADAVQAAEEHIAVPAPGLDAEIGVTVWAPGDLRESEPAPLLLVHDGPEFAKLGGFTQYAAASIHSGALPPLRVALLEPGDRNAWYSANPGYADALCTEVVAAVEAKAPSTSRVGIGASLGGLAMLHAHRCHPNVFDALLLQSASFFTDEHDSHEHEFDGFAAITAFVREVGDADTEPAAIPVTLTCGTVEENLANNRAMAAQLRRLGYRARLVEVRDAHNYTAWRDALDPNLTELVARVVDGARAA
jgi:enterochelin esterase-like enzyme